MSTDATYYLSLRLEGPLQAWGFNSQYSRRNTGLFPTKSGILGLCCAALGLPRGSDLEAEWLKSLQATRMLVLAMPRIVSAGQGTRLLPVRRITDYHTVQNTKTANGGTKDAHLTYRQYLCDSAFGAVLAGERKFLEEVARALDNPAWGVWLGRKACIPTAPVFSGLFETQDEALSALIGNEPLSNFTYQQEVERFEEGEDSLPDEPVSFGSTQHPRAYLPRRIRIVEAKHEPKT